jgi:hypothetical protein
MERIFEEVEDLDAYFPVPWEVYVTLEGNFGAKVFVKKERKTHYAPSDFLNFLKYELWYQGNKGATANLKIYHTPLHQTVAMKIKIW